MTGKSAILPDNPRILVARTDRIGDVALSLPVFASIRRACPEAYICALARRYTSDLLTDRPDVDEVIAFDSDAGHVPRGVFFELLGKIKNKRFDAAIALFSNFSVAALLALAGIPVRVGPASKLAQVFFTHRVRQRRSKGLRHEADHNLDLLKTLGIPVSRQASIAPPREVSSPISVKTGGKPLVGVHPGSGGSSRNWPEKNYARLVAEIVDAGADVVVTGSPGERSLVERVAGASGRDPGIYTGSGGLRELIAVLSRLDVFVASSTGPLHVASAVGTPVVGIYCPIFVCLPQRWGPIGANDSALVPDVEPCDRCVGEKCAEWDCMEKVTVGRVRDEALGKIGSSVRH